MIAKKGASVILILLILVSLVLVLGCGREKAKTDFELGKENFLASNYIQAIMRLETYLTEPSKKSSKESSGISEALEAHAMLAVMYRNDETRQALFEEEMKKLQAAGKQGMAVVLKLGLNPTTESRLGSTIIDILVRGGELSMEPLLNDLNGPNPRLRVFAQNVLIEMGAMAVDPLIKLLNNPDPYARSRSIEILSKIGDKRVIEPLKQKLNDPVRLVQVQAAAALYGMGQQVPVDIIINGFKDQDVVTRKAATKAAWEMLDNPPLNPLLKVMIDNDPDVRNYAVLAIGKTRSPEAVEPLIKVLQGDAVDQVKNSAAKSLEAVGKPAVDPLINLLETTKDIGTTIRIVQVLGNIGDKRAIKPLEKVYNGATNPLLKNETAKALNKID